MNVVVRVRPHTAANPDALVTVGDDAKSICVLKEAANAPSTAIEFKFGTVFPPPAQTTHLYDIVLRPIVANVLKGIPGCIFAYGQTGSGKTHTVTGTSDSPGLLRLAVEELLERTARDSDVVTSCVYLTYLEIYNEIIRDLLNPGGAALNLLEDARGCPHLPGMTRVPVGSAEDAVAVAAKGEAYRAKGANRAHEHASRSHAIFTITVETRRKDEKDLRIGLLHVVDLAGSETALHGKEAAAAAEDCAEVLARRQALSDMANSHLIEKEAKTITKGNREGCHIRRSLLALVNVVTKLADKAAFVPYRDSKLTRLLRPPLEGNSNTAVICTVNPGEGKETLSTLRFAATAQRIHRTPATTAALSTEGSMLRSYEQQITALKAELARQAAEDRRRASADVTAKKQLEAAHADRAALEAKCASLNSVLLTSAFSRSLAPPTPRGVAKDLLLLEREGLRRSASAPHRRGCVLRGAGNAVVEPTPAPQWLREAAAEETVALRTKATALEQEKERWRHGAMDLSAELSAALEVIRELEADRQALRAALVSDGPGGKSRGFLCTSAAEREQKPSCRPLHDIVGSQPRTPSGDEEKALSIRLAVL